MLRGSKVEMEERDIGKNPLSVDELRVLFAGRPAAEFLNTRNEEAREHGWNKTPPSEATLLAAMARNPNLIRRPLLVVNGKFLIGFDKDAYAAL